MSHAAMASSGAPDPLRRRRRQQPAATFGSTLEHAHGVEATAGTIVEMSPQRQANLVAVRNVLSLVALVGFLGAAESVARSVEDGDWVTWQGSWQEFSYGLGQVALQACLVLSGMIVTHLILRSPPQRVPRYGLGRMVSCLAVIVPALLLLGVAALLRPDIMVFPRAIMAMVMTYPLCIALTGFLLGSMRRRRHAVALSLLALGAWMAGGMVLGTAHDAGPASALPDSMGLSSGVESGTLVMMSVMGVCYWSGAVVVVSGALVDARSWPIRSSVPLVALVAYVLFLPQTLIGTSVGHIFLATALAPLMDLRLPRFLGRMDVGLALLTLGWPLAIVLSWMFTGQQASAAGSILAVPLAVLGACALAIYVARPIEKRILRGADPKRPAAALSPAAPSGTAPAGRRG